jgi:hypothetical protein
MNSLKVFFILLFLVIIFIGSSIAQISRKAERAELLAIQKLKKLDVSYFNFTFSDSPVIRDTRIFDENGKRIDKINSNSSPDTYVYEGYDKDGNSVGILGAPTKELRYECPICKGASVLNIRNVKFGIPVMVSCWRCNGKGYLVSNSGK